MQRNLPKAKVWGFSLTLGLIVTSISLFSRTASTSSTEPVVHQSGETADSLVKKSELSSYIGPAVKANAYPQLLELPVEGVATKARVGYSLDDEAQREMQKLMNQYLPDYGAFVAMDAKTGRILSMVSVSRAQANVSNLALRATFPSASIFKVVTASAAIDLKKADPSTVVPFNGANHTLYKRNISDARVNRWTRHMTLREAFGRSVNTIFGKLGLFFVGPQALRDYAERYMFNQSIHADVPVETGFARFSDDDPWSVVTAASGFTRDNTMSPLQGAMIASAIANDGIMMEPYLVDNLVGADGASLYQVQPRQASVVVEPQSAQELRELFRQTVTSGTSRKSFRKTVRRSDYDDVEFGGKTGSLTGTNPQGKCDWFVGYARYRDQRIAVAALTVNEKKWRVKSSMLANLYLAAYIKRDLKKSEVARR